MIGSEWDQSEAASGSMAIRARPLDLPQASPIGQLRQRVPFPDAARIALRDSQLRANLRRATATIRAKRIAAVGEVPDWEALRFAGAAAKDDALERLDELLATFTQQVERAGGHVHVARDATEANDIVCQLVVETGASEVVKVKSMTTQEIGLNDALEAVGIHAIETDLAELIVQLAHDLPSHILVPAIHRNRSEIRQIFLDHMPGVDPGLTDEPASLAAAARRYLRDRFLRASVGISSANFAVAETGTLVVVESEGNGRMCLTLPETLISVVGIEKLVANWRDLGIFFQLLPRSSTAERMNPYTSTWTGVTPGDGPRNFHVVLVDNGRRATRADPVGRAALRCIRCSACLNVCPVYERVGGHAYGSAYPGPIGAILSPQLTGIEDNWSLPFASTLCGACYEVCPVRIDIPDLLVELRGRHIDQARTEPSRATPRRRLGGRLEAGLMSLVAWVMGGPRRWGAATRLVGVLSPLAAKGYLNHLPPPLNGWTESRALPPLPRESFRTWWVRTQSGQASSGTPGTEPGCSADRNAPASGGQPTRGEAATGPAPTHLHLPTPTLTPSRAGDLPVGTPTRVGASPRSVKTSPPVSAGTSPAALLARFAERLADYGSGVRFTDPAGLTDVIAGLVRPGLVLAAPGLDPAWLASIPGASRDDPSRPASELDAVATAVTACRLAIAETGTIVLDHQDDQGRRALSLIPDHHVCIIRAEQIVANVAEAVEALDPARPLTWISGPSATSDIELQRVVGVHGPRQLDAILVVRPENLPQVDEPAFSRSSTPPSTATDSA
jgi:L-lactate dehydrogenase complex protein LldF